MPTALFSDEEISAAHSRLNAYHSGTAYALPPAIQDALAVPISHNLLADWCVFREQNYHSFSGATFHAFLWDVRRLVNGDTEFRDEFVTPLLQAWNQDDEDYEALWAAADRPRRDDDLLVLQDLASIHHNSANNGLWELIGFDDADEAERANVIALHIMFGDLTRAEFDRLDVVVGNTDPVAVSNLLLAKPVLSLTNDDIKGLPIRDRLRIENKIIEARYAEGKSPMAQVLQFSNMPQSSAALPLVYFGECRTAPTVRFHVKGVIAEGATSSIYGQPKTLKSTLATDLGIHLAAARDWRSHKIKEARGVVYFAFERAAQVRKALSAYAIRDGFDDLPFAVVGRIVDMLNPACIDIMDTTIEAAEKHFGIPVGLAIFDTWSKGIAAGGGNEDKAEHQNIAAANLRRLIEKRPTLHCLSIGHTGKDTAKGERGSNATMGDRDVGILVEGTGNVRKATIAYANELPDGELTAFEGEQIVVGQDDDGEPVTAFIVSKRIVSLPPSRTVTTRQDLALKALRRAVEGHGQEPPAGSDIPGYIRVVSVEHWREELFRNGVLKRDAKNPRQPFRRLKLDLLGADQIVERDGFVWPMQPGGIILPPFPNA